MTEGRNPPKDKEPLIPAAPANTDLSLDALRLGRELDRLGPGEYSVKIEKGGNGRGFHSLIAKVTSVRELKPWRQESRRRP